MKRLRARGGCRCRGRGALGGSAKPAENEGLQFRGGDTVRCEAVGFLQVFDPLGHDPVIGIRKIVQTFEITQIVHGLFQPQHVRAGIPDRKRAVGTGRGG